MYKIMTAAMYLIIATSDDLFSKEHTMGMKKEMSPEVRKTMAAIHDKMASCLRTDKKLIDCREEMRVECENSLGEKSCPMMGRRMRGEMEDFMHDDASTSAKK